MHAYCFNLETTEEESRVAVPEKAPFGTLVNVLKSNQLLLRRLVCHVVLSCKCFPKSLENVVTRDM